MNSFRFSITSIDTTKLNSSTTSASTLKRYCRAMDRSRVESMGREETQQIHNNSKAAS